MDEETRKEFERMDKRFITVTDSINNFSGNILRLNETVADIKNQLSQNCAKLDKIITHFDLG
jgi:predicted  nucleic acid-binding Zn-ribbon protein